MKLASRFGAVAMLAAPALGQAPAKAAGKKPNILVMFGDDIGYWNISAYNRGMMGYRTPNIDRIAKEGAIFTDAYGQQSCTAGRAAFITGQSPIRTGLLKVGLPGAPEGLSDKDPTIANLLKAQGYATGQFGKNHLGDRNEFIPTVHGFDEFFGNFYHLNAEEEPENPDYPKAPSSRSSRRCSARAASSTAAPPTPRARSPTTRRFGEVGQAALRGHRPAHEEADGDDRRGGARPDPQVPRREAEGRQALVRLVQHDPHAHQHPPQGGVARARPGWASSRTAWSSTTATSASC